MMYYVVCPLSLAATRPSWVPIILINNLAIHMFGIGVPIAFITSRVMWGGTPASTPRPAVSVAAGS